MAMIEDNFDRFELRQKLREERFQSLLFSAATCLDKYIQGENDKDYLMSAVENLKLAERIRMHHPELDGVMGCDAVRRYAIMDPSKHSNMVEITDEHGNKTGIFKPKVR